MTDIAQAVSFRFCSQPLTGCARLAVLFVSNLNESTTDADDNEGRLEKKRGQVNRLEELRSTEALFSTASVDVTHVFACCIASFIHLFSRLSAGS